jgi:two-component system, sporulation sensor kinase E
MFHKPKNVLAKQSIINLTLLKVTLSIFGFIIIFLIIYGKVFWDKETLKLNNDLLRNSLNVQYKIQSNSEIIYNIDIDVYSTSYQKELVLRKVLQPIINENKITLGYYDLNLGLWIKNSSIVGEAYEKSFKENEIDKYPFHANKDIVLKIPVYYSDKIIGYLWSYSENNNMVFNSYNELNGLIILILSLSSIIIIILRRNFKLIKYHLEGFSRMITETESYIESQVLDCKLPELNPILGKISYFTDNLKRINSELEFSKLKLTQIMDGISDGFFAMDRKFAFTYVNPETQRIYQNSFFIGETIWALFPHILGTLTDEKLNEAMDSGETVYWEAEGFIESNQFYEFHAYPFEDGLTVFFRNITTLKQQQYELARLERLNLVGQLAAGISHEIRNPLTTVKGFLQIFSSKPSFENEKENLDLMISEIDRANEIITGFLSLAKVNADNIQMQSLNKIIHKVFPMIQADAFNNNKEIIAELNEIPEILVNENEIKQLILNLVRNGLEVTPENGRVVLGTSLQNERVILTIKDQGPGIPPEIQLKIGTPFFTTKETGTGLGLAISLGIVQRHNAVLKFETGASGTTFRVIFPLVN